MSMHRNNKLINNKGKQGKKIILLSLLFVMKKTKKKQFVSVPDTLFHETDPRTRTQIKMKRINGTDYLNIKYSLIQKVYQTIFQSKGRRLVFKTRVIIHIKMIGTNKN